jgi:hypothetical protein
MQQRDVTGVLDDHEVSMRHFVARAAYILMQLFAGLATSFFLHLELLQDQTAIDITGGPVDLLVVIFVVRDWPRKAPVSGASVAMLVLKIYLLRRGDSLLFTATGEKR